MTIAIDIRALNERVGGVVEYTRNLVCALIESEREHTYVLFTNAWKGHDSIGIPDEGPHHRIMRFSYPNKLFHALQLICKHPLIDRMIEKKIGRKIDLFFMPNMHFGSLSPYTPLVVTIHDLSFMRYPELLSPKSYRWHRLIRPRALIARANAIIAVSQSTKRDCVSLCQYPERHTAVTSLDCDPLFGNEMHHQSVNTGKKNSILLFGVHEMRKNAESVLEAFALLLSRCSTSSDVQLILIGKRGKMFNHLARKICELGLSNHVQLLESQSQQGRISLYRSARILLYPSFYEGFGLPLLEAAHARVSIIASNRGSIGEVIGRGAVLVDPYNSEEIACAFEQVLIHQDATSLLADTAQKYAEQYSWKVTAQRTRAILQDVAMNQTICA